jgi:predicted MFS family arabinose efflux permease
MKQPKFSGYRMEFCVIMLTLCTLGLGFVTLNVYVPSLTQELGTSVSAVSVMFAAMGVTSMLANFISGPVSRKIGLKRMILIGVAALLSGYSLLAVATNITMLYIAGALIGVSLSWAGVICIGRVVSNWFIAKRGLMIGLATGGAGLGPVIGGPLISFLTESAGWRTACLTTLAIMAVLTIPAAILLKAHPADINQVPLTSHETDQADASAQNTSGPTAQQARKSLASALMVVVVLGGIYVAAGYGMHFTNLLVNNGHTLTFAGSMLAVSGVTGMMASILLGVINDKAGTTWAVLFGSTCALASFILALFLGVGAAPLAIAFAVFFGFAQPTAGAMTTVLTARTFGPNAFPTMLGIINALGSFMSIFMPVAVGLLFEATGTYTASAIVGIVLAVLIAVGGITAIKAGDHLARKVAHTQGTTLDLVGA